MVPQTCDNNVKVNFGDYLPLSTIDWPGRASVVFFLRGCPYRCPYCQNYSILSGSDLVDPGQIEQLIESSKLFVSTVVFSGGEPLQQEGAILELASIAKEMDLDVGIHTNGAYPEVLRKLCEKKLVDGVFIDVKAPLDDPETYGKMIGYDTYSHVVMPPEEVVENVRSSVEIAAEKGVLKELRTTVLPRLMDSASLIESTVLSILPFLELADVSYIIQQGRPSHSFDRALRELSPLLRNDLLQLSKTALEHTDNIWIRTHEKGCEKVNFGMI